MSFLSLDSKEVLGGGLVLLLVAFSVSCSSLAIALYFAVAVALAIQMVEAGLHALREFRVLDGPGRE